MSGVRPAAGARSEDESWGRREGTQAGPPSEDRPAGRAPLSAWAELLRVSAALTVPGDALAGAAASGRGANRGTLCAVGSSLCLYQAGMALNDWADRRVDAVERPHRPLPSGRISPPAALTAAAGLTVAGLGCAALAGRPALATATVLAGAVWAYDLGLKNTAAGPATMALARTLDVLVGAVATAARPGTPGRGAPAGAPGSGTPGRVPTGGDPPATRLRGPGRPEGTAAPTAGRHPVGRFGSAVPSWAAGTSAARAALPSAALLGAHTLAVTTVSRRETVGGSAVPQLLALAAVGAVTAALTREGSRGRARPGTAPAGAASRLPTALLAGGYAVAAGRPLLHAALNPSAPLVQRAVGAGIRAMVPLQSALASRSGAPGWGLSGLALLPLARRLSRKVSPT